MAVAKVVIAKVMLQEEPMDMADITEGGDMHPDETVDDLVGVVITGSLRILNDEGYQQLIRECKAWGEIQASQSDLTHTRQSDEDNSQAPTMSPSAPPTQVQVPGYNANDAQSVLTGMPFGCTASHQHLFNIYGTGYTKPTSMGVHHIDFQNLGPNTLLCQLMSNASA